MNLYKNTQKFIYIHKRIKCLRISKRCTYFVAMQTSNNQTPAKHRLKELGACKEALEWVGDRTIEQAIKDCERTDWILWLFKELMLYCPSLMAIYNTIYLDYFFCTLRKRHMVLMKAKQTLGPLIIKHFHDPIINEPLPF